MAAESVGECVTEFIKSLDLNNAEKINTMFQRLIQRGDLHIKSQQRSDTDLTDVEKLKILRSIFENNPRLFLARFGKWMSIEDLRCFSPTEGSEMEYAICVLRKRLEAKSRGVYVKNRRYEALQRLERETSYFNEEEMQQRCPLLYEEYIGQHMTEEEKFEKDDAKMRDEVKMSSFIFQQIDNDWLKNKREEQREMKACVEEEEEESEEEEMGCEEENCQDHEIQPTISEEDKLKLREEFLEIMKQRFLEGLDEDFDYKEVDTNDEYDNLVILDQDEEEKYFDNEEPEMFVDEDLNKENVTTDSDDDYLSDKILEKCCEKKR